MAQRQEEHLAVCEFATASQIRSVNFRPHPYTVGPRHVAQASKHYGGMLTEEVMREIPCAHPGCKLSFDEHTSDHVSFIRLTRDASGEEVRAWLKALVDSGVTPTNKCDGFAFVKTGFHIVENEDKP